MFNKIISIKTSTNYLGEIIYNPSMDNKQLIFDDNTVLLRQPSTGHADKCIVNLADDGTANLIFIKFTRISNDHVDEAIEYNRITFPTHDYLRQLNGLITEAFNNEDSRET